ncbi:MAG: haloacid dehalogenase [Rhodobacteraceae bacterium]|nr:haloacid dehalogenase [Paracoccaceae bacterium]
MTDLVIFDCDGVLVNSETIANEVLVADLAGYGLHVTLEESEKMFVGGTIHGVFLTARQMGADLPDGWVDGMYQQIFARLSEGVELMPGVIDLLDLLDERGIPFCVASNGPPDKMRITLGQNGQWDRFEANMVSAHTHGVAKPDPGLFLAAAEPFGASPDRTVVIEDSRNGVTAATGAGMRCLALVPDGDGAHLEHLGAEVIRHMDEVREKLRL